MALKIRLRKQGRNNHPFYRVVVTDVRAPRGGKYLESVGWYNPFEKELEKLLHFNTERLQHWLDLGAQATEKVEALMAQGAPAVHRGQVEKRLANRAKEAAKRRSKKEGSTK